MNSYINHALKYAEMSTAKDFKHGAVCVIGGKVVSGGCNYLTRPHRVYVGTPTSRGRVPFGETARIKRQEKCVY